MKVKVKLDKDAILGGLIEHGEKIAFGVFLLMFVLLCFGALKQSPYDKTPEKFLSEATRVDQLVASGSLDPKVALSKLPQIKVSEITKILPGDFLPKGPINAPPGESGSQRRGEPKFLTVQDLQAGTAYGAVSVKPAEDPVPVGRNRQVGAPVQQPVAGSDIRGKQWAVITGLVPSPQQVKEYQSTFANAPQPKLDLPHWRKYEVQRQEGEGAWTPLNLQAIEAAARMRVVTEPDPGDLRNLTVLKELCELAPKLVAKLHDNSIIHPKIAELAAEQIDKLKVQPVMNNNQPPPMAAQGGARVQELLPEYTAEQMFRCFDYTVQPGKSYRYKVRLVLENPNWDLARYMVENAEMLKGSTRASDWSEPSPVVNVPAASSILAGPVERPRSLSQEAMCQTILRKWDPVLAVDALKFARLWRGQMANYTVDTPTRDPITGKVLIQPVNFQTNSVLIDMAGGESLPTYRGRSPGRMLLLSPTGELDVKSELADVAAFDSEVDRMAELAKAADPEPDPAPVVAPKVEADGDGKKRGRDRERGKRDP